MPGTHLLARWAAASLLLAGNPALATAPPATEEAALDSLQGVYARAVAPGEDAALYRELLGTVMQRIKRSSVASVDLAALAAEATKAIEPLPSGVGEPAEVFKRALHGSMRAIDPHFRYLDARTYGTERSDSMGSFSGLGLQVEPSGSAVRIVAPIPGGPAERAGLLAGDLIVRVDDQSVSGLPLADAIARMRGQPGSPVSLTIQRIGMAHELTVSLTRETIRRQVLRWNMEGEVLVLRLAGFTEAVSASLEQAIAQATAERSPKAVVLDLRGNPGGMFREAVKVADAFLSSGEIVSLRGNSSARNRSWQADPGELLAGVPMVVLIDGRSASASELVADALQQNGRAVLMGQRSFGKGSVQTTIPLGADKGAIKLTTAIYHGPSGQTLHQTGVAPDVELLGPARTDSLRDLREGSLQARGGATPLKALSRLDPARCPTVAVSDPALSCALAYLLAGSVDAFAAGLADLAH